MNDISSFFNDERLLRLIVQASPAGMVLADGAGCILLVNQQALEFFGYSESELLGETVEKLIPEAHRGSHTSHRARYMSQPEARSMAAGRDLFGRRKDGSEFPVDISLHPLQTAGGVLVLANILDATERRRAARERERRQAIERLAQLGQLAGGVAHEIRTPLCVIRNDVYYLQTLTEKLGPEGAECIEEINQAVGKANRIVSELLDFTREPPSHPAPVAVEDVLAEALSDFPIPSSIDFVRPPPLGALQVSADREQVARILANLFRNAVQAMKGTGRIQLTITAQGEQVEWFVQDSGPGIAEEERELVFEPLFSNKQHGIGLGLAVSRRYARRNHGDLVLQPSCSEGGACFRLSLPRAQGGGDEEGAGDE